MTDAYLGWVDWSAAFGVGLVVVALVVLASMSRTQR